jgi:hypothetical protein
VSRSETTNSQKSLRVRKLYKRSSPSRRRFLSPDFLTGAFHKVQRIHRGRLQRGKAESSGYARIFLRAKPSKKSNPLPIRTKLLGSGVETEEVEIIRVPSGPVVLPLFRS